MATKLGVYNEAAVLVGQPRLETVTDNVAIRYALDDEYAGAVDYVLTQVPWRFALNERAQPVDTTPGVPTRAGYAYTHALASQVLRVISIHTAASGSGRRLPIDCKMEAGYVYTNINGSIRVLAIETTARTETLWPEPFAKVVAAYLAFKVTQRITALNGRTDDLFGYYERELVKAAEREAVPESPWLIHQLSGLFLSSQRYLLEQGFWEFALKSETLSASGSPFPGFSNRFAKPADWVRTHAIYTIDANGREIPIDAREHEGFYSSDLSNITIRYVSSTNGLDVSKQPEQFLRCTAAHLGIDMGDMGVRADDQGRTERPIVWPEYLGRALAEVGVRPNAWLKAQTDGSFRAAVQRVIESAFWRFALRNEELVSTTGPISPFTTAYNMPSSHLVTHSVYYASSAVQGGKEFPVWFWRSDTKLSCDVASNVRMRFITRDAVTAYGSWPDEFLNLVGYEIGAGPIAGAPPEVFAAYRANAISQHAEAASPWLPFQQDGRYRAAAEAMLQKAFWRFAMKQQNVSADAVPSGQFPGYANSFSIPADHVRTRGLFVRTGSDEHPADIREDGAKWSANVASIVAHFTSRTLGMDVTKWPADYLDLVGAYLGIYSSGAQQPGNDAERWPQYLAQCEQKLAVQVSPWLKYQLDGSFAPGIRALLWEQDWRFAAKTTILNSSATGGIGHFDYTFTLPADWAATIRVFKIENDEELDVDFRQQLSSIYANVDPIYIRYLDVDIINDTSLWPEYFDNCLLAFLAYREVLGDPSTPGAVIERRKAALNDALRNAKLRDDMRERPKFNRYGGRFVTARQSGFYKHTREQG